MHLRPVILGAVALCACTDPVVPTDPSQSPPASTAAVVKAADTLYDILDLGPAPHQVDMLLTPAGDLYFHGLVAGRNQSLVLHDGIVTPLPDLGGGDATVAAVNASGAAVGRSYDAGLRYHAFLWQGGAMTDLGTLGGATSRAWDIDDHGVVVGEAATATGVTHAFRWENGVMTDLGTGGIGRSSARKINVHGLIMGTADVTTIAGPKQHAVTWRRDVMTDLGPLPGIVDSMDVYPNDLADDGTVVGYSMVPGPGGSAIAFRSIGGSLEPLAPSPGARVSEALFVDDRRMVAGHSISLSLGDGPGAGIWKRGVFQALGDLPIDPKDFTHCDYCLHDGEYVTGMNDAGWIIGRSTVFISFSRGFLWRDGVLTRLPDLGGQFVEPNMINDDGVIAGVATDSTHQMHALVWRPRASGTAAPAAAP